MTSSFLERMDRRAVVITGLILGVAPSFLGTAAGTLVGGYVLWSLVGKSERRLAIGDLVRLAAVWLLAVMACDVLLHPASCLEGWTAGLNAGSYWQPRS